MSAAAPASFKLNRKEAAALLREPSTFGTVILAILVGAYGTEVLSKDVLEIYADVREDFNAIIPEEGENRLNAVMMCVTTDLFYREPEVFRAVCTSLYDGDMGDLVSGALEELTVPEMLWAIYEVGLLQDDTPDFAPAVEKAIAAEFLSEAREEGGAEFYEDFIEEARQELIEQLSVIGMRPEQLNDIV
jgi:hypothetical protein